LHILFCVMRCANNGIDEAALLYCQIVTGAAFALSRPL
jgi:hypothetical protein